MAILTIIFTIKHNKQQLFRWENIFPTMVRKRHENELFTESLKIGFVLFVNGIGILSYARKGFEWVKC